MRAESALGDPLVVVGEPLDALLHRLLERRKLERLLTGLAVDKLEELLV